MSHPIVVDHPPNDDEIKKTASSRREKNKRLSALLIGIDKYTSVSQLSGAVADVNNMKNFLVHTVDVPEERITTLLDGEATRDAILARLVKLQSSKDILKNDPILIFYAGHGARPKAPQGWDTKDGHIEMILPVNFSTAEDPTRDKQGIPDFLLAKHLVELAVAKGDNITVILDCCYAGGAARDATAFREVILPPEYEPSASVFAEFTASDGRAAKVATGYELHGGASHILLSACKQTEKAGDTDEGGRFTLALLESLRKKNACNVAYSRILGDLSDLGRMGQHPQCEGKNVSRILFSADDSVRTRICYPVDVTSKSDRILLRGGDIHGITPGAEFDVYANIDLTCPPVCRLVAQSIHACTADMVLSADSGEEPIGLQAWAVQTKAGVRTDEFTVAVPKSLLKDLQNELDNDTSVEKRALSFVEYDPVGEPTVKVDLKVELDGDRVRFFVYDKDSDSVDALTGHSSNAALGAMLRLAEALLKVSKCILSWCGWRDAPSSPRGRRELRSCDEKKRIYAIIQSAARFSFYLHRSSADKPLGTRLTLRAFELEPEPARDHNADNPPIRKLRSEDLVKDGTVNVTVPKPDLEEAPYPAYGFELENRSTRPLFAWIFMFDLAALEISLLHRPSIAKTGAQPCILPQSSLTIGYGASDVPPREFFIPEGLAVDVSYLKVFLASAETDLSVIEQDSPFADSKRGDRPSSRVLSSGSIWDTVKIAIIQEVGRVTDADVPSK